MKENINNTNDDFDIKDADLEKMRMRHYELDIETAENGEQNDIEIQDIGKEDLERQVLKETNTILSPPKKKKNKFVATTVIFLLTTLTVGAACVMLYLQNNELRNKGNDNRPVTNGTKPGNTGKDDAMQAGSDAIYYTQDELEKYAKEASDEAVKAYNDDMIDKIVSTMESDGTLITLRNLVKDKMLVIQAAGKYNFIPLLDDIKRHNYVPENFVKNDNGIVEYFEGGVLASHKGIDVSRFQGEIDWKKVAADDVKFALIRLGLRGYGTGVVHLDANYVANMTGANEAGVDKGVYFYSQAITEEEALEEANFVIENLEGYDIELPVVLDVEYVAGDDARANALTKEERTKIAKTFCDAIEEAGYEAMIYGNMQTFLMMLDLTELKDIKKWFAYYNLPHYYPYEFDIWQYTDSGKVDGITGVVDMNIIIGEYPW